MTNMDHKPVFIGWCDAIGRPADLYFIMSCITYTSAWSGLLNILHKYSAEYFQSAPMSEISSKDILLLSHVILFIKITQKLDCLVRLMGSVKRIH